MSNISNSPNTAIDKPNQFPWKLYDMLHTAEKRNEEHIISWIKDGKAFKVHNRNLFIEEYMKKLFNQTKFKSFQRQLNLWGFERVQNGPDKGSYFHPLFVKGRRDCCQRLTRVKLKGRGENVAQQGGVDSSKQDYSPTSVASATTTTCSAVSATGAASFPAAPLPVAARAGSVATTTPSSSSSLLGAFIDVPGPTANTVAIEASLQEGSSRQQQVADLIHYHTSQRRREMIRNAAISLRPDLSLAIVGAPRFATASNTFSNIIVSNSLQRGQMSQNQQQQQQQQQHEQLEQQQQQQQQPQHQNHQQQHLQLSAHQEYQSQHQSQLLQQQHENTHTHTHTYTQQLEQQLQIRPQSQPQETRRRSSGSSGLEALLSVSAQRRREEELALLLDPSDPGGMSHKR